MTAPSPDRAADDGRFDHRQLHRYFADGGFDGEFFRTVVERVGVGVAVYDESGSFTYANEAFAAILGTDRASIVERTIWDVNPAIDASRFRDYWDSFAVGETREHEVNHVRADGETVPVETVTTAIDVEGTVYHVGTISDVTDRVEDWAEMERQDERLAEVASVISHDLRNPLNVAMGRAELAAMDCESEHLEYVERSLRKMELLITDVLTIARKGSRITDAQPIEIENAATTAWYEATDTEHATLDLHDDLGTVSSEGDRVQELFASLFSNAITHAGPEVTITVGRFEDGFFVADDGPGVSPDDPDTVFDYGYSTIDDGTGFGLPIVEHIAAAHGWSVAMVESDDGGARVEVRGVDFLD